MAKRQKKTVIDLCDRCAFGKQRTAVGERVFALDDRYYKVMVCEEHGEMFDRDMSRWTLLSEEIDNPYSGRGKSVFFTEERNAEVRRIRELAEQARHEQASREFAARRIEEMRREEEDRARHAIPGAMKYRLTDHSRERMYERGFTPWDVFQAVAHPEHVTRQTWLHPTRAVAYRDDCRVVFDTHNGGILTVIERGAKVEEAPPESTQPTRQPERTAL